MDHPADNMQMRQIWLNQMRKELRLSESDDLVTELEPGIRLDPALTASEINHRLETTWPQQPWMPGQQVEVGPDLGLAQLQVRTALRGGAQCLWLVLHRQMDRSHYQDLLHGVQLELITLLVEPAASEYALASWRELDQFLSLASSLPVEGGYFFPEGEAWQHLDWDDLSLRYPNWYWRKIRPETVPSFSDRLIGILSHTQRFLSSLSGLTSSSQDTWLSRIAVEWPGDNRLLTHLAATRALHILWQNLYLSDAGKPPVLLGWIGGDSYTKEANTNLIRAAAMATTLSISGVHSIYIQPADQFDQINHQRLALNILQLLQLESHLQPGEDPVSGSYVLDDLTRQFAEKAWNQWRLMD